MAGSAPPPCAARKIKGQEDQSVKSKRQEKILELIEKYDIETQE